MRQLVIGVIPRAEELTGLAVGREPGEGSAAQRFLSDNLNLATSRGSTHVRHAHLATAFYNATALDHMRAFVTLLRAGRHIMPLATVTRAAVEAFAKANYLLSATSIEELLHRHISLANMELFVSTKHSEFAFFDGTGVDGKEYLEGIRGLLAQLGLGKIDRIGLTTLASDLLSESSPGALGRHFYSQLSSVAHGETAGVSMFIQEAPESRLHFVPRRDVLLPYAGILFATCRVVLEKLIEHFGMAPEHREGWRGVIERAEPWIVELSDSDPLL